MGTAADGDDDSNWEASLPEKLTSPFVLSGASNFIDMNASALNTALENACIEASRIFVSDDFGVAGIDIECPSSASLQAEPGGILPELSFCGTSEWAVLFFIDEMVRTSVLQAGALMSKVVGRKLLGAIALSVAAGVIDMTVLLVNKSMDGDIPHMEATGASIDAGGVSIDGEGPNTSLPSKAAFEDVPPIPLAVDPKSLPSIIAALSIEIFDEIPPAPPHEGAAVARHGVSVDGGISESNAACEGFISARGETSTVEGVIIFKLDSFKGDMFK